jgi:hypothetical protein
MGLPATMKWAATAAVLAVLAGGGCSSGERLLPAGGRVTGPGARPLADVRLVFIAKGRSLTATGRTDPEGRYALGSRRAGGGLPAGDYAVLAIDDAPGGDIDHPLPSRIASRYADPATSGLEARVAPGGGPIDFRLE